MWCQPDDEQWLIPLGPPSWGSNGFQQLQVLVIQNCTISGEPDVQSKAELHCLLSCAAR